MDIKKIVSGNVAKFSHYKSGNLYYNIDIDESTYQFPIPTVDSPETPYFEKYLKEIKTKDGILSDAVVEYKEVNACNLSTDLGDAEFEAEYKAITLMRYIRKAIDSDLFYRIK
jgi:hypothetical protein